MEIRKWRFGGHVDIGTYGYNGARLRNQLEARDGMDFIPAVFAIRDISTGYTDTTADAGGYDIRGEPRARSFGFAIGRRVIADKLNDKVAMAVNHVYKIQDGLPIGIEVDMQVPIRVSVDGHDAALDRGTPFKDTEPFRTVNVIPETGIAALGW